MGQATWYRRGPSVWGYQPGWLWWAAALIVLVFAGTMVARQVQRKQINVQYINERIAFHADEQGLDAALVEAIVEAESGGDWLAESDAGAKGLMQIMPIALKDVRQREGVGPGDLFDPDYNLRVGTLYLRYLLDRFEDDLVLTIAAYHMGPTGVARGQRTYPGLSPRDMIRKHAGPKTRAYVDQVLERYGKQ